MNKYVHQLYCIAQKPTRKIIGLMSGTSVDGLDIALVECSGHGMATQLQLLEFKTANYPKGFKDEIAQVFSKQQVNLEKLCLLNPWIAQVHAKQILDALQEWKISVDEVDLIASHGQTIYHAPKSLHQKEGFPNATLQIGDGDHLAVSTGIITISDFRQKHIAAGGEGAPLAVYGDYLIFSSDQENRIMLNIGGIANFTFLPKSKNANEVFSTDVGPGNTMMDAYAKKYFNLDYDEHAAIASKGKVHLTLLNQLKTHPFFNQPFPKTTGPELFNLNYLEQALQRIQENLSPEDVMATLNQFAADSIVQSLLSCTNVETRYTIYVSGGGMHNPLLLSNIQNQLPHFQLKTTSDLAIHPDAKEAVLFAVLANECVSGGELSMNSNPMQGIPSVTMGKISFPG